jgi:DNA-binding HxlR family transcriptional regulator
VADTPLPGKPVRGSSTGRPVMALFDLLGRNWTMRILWELCHDGPCTFRELQGQCESVSPGVLNSRLKELREAQLIELGAKGYQPTAMGRSLFKVLLPLDRWSKRWATSLARDHLPSILP